MKRKIVMLPLDERPCNYDYPAMMPKTDFELIMPPRTLMSRKKEAADVEGISEWLINNAENADAMIVSLDMLVYGGIVPSRLHENSKEDLLKRVEVIKKLRELNPNMKLYVFGLIMRCPSYSSADEEPDYYEECGAEIHLFGRYTHLEKLGRLSESDCKDFERVKKAIKKEYLEDYLKRRETNKDVLLRALNYANDGTVDYFIIPQDDAAVYGFTSMDQMLIRSYLKTNTLHKKTAMYPSADDTGLTLLARAVAQLSGVRPKVYVHYSSSKGGMTVPIVEDRIVDETVKYHIMSVDGIQVYSLAEADILLAVNVGSEMHELGEVESVIPYDIERNLAEFVNYIQYALSLKKIVAVADIARLNKGDEELFSLLYKENLLLKIHSYAGWNTSSNTMGTAMCQAILYMLGEDKPGNISFLLHRYYEDIGYMVYARQYVSEKLLPDLGLDYFHVDAEKGKASELVKENICTYMSENYPEIADLVEDAEVRMPWIRMFETDIKLKINK